MKGRLFDDLDGTEAQLDFLSNGGPEADYFLGIRRVFDGAYNVYEKLDGQRIENSLLTWSKTHALTSAAIESPSIVVLNTVKHSPDKYLNVFSDLESTFSICDMRGSS